jgi:polyisoprenoid-binding protein YceI
MLWLSLATTAGVLRSSVPTLHTKGVAMKRALLAVLFIAVTALAAGPRPHLVDKAHSQINFVAEAKFISAHGYFDKWEAEVALDPQKVEDSTVKIIIDAASINTRIQMRDNHLRSKDFFWVEQFPQITFTSKKVSKVADKKFKVLGDLTLRGVTKEIEIPVDQVFYENNRGRFRSEFQINRRDFGINYQSNMNPIEDIVKVQFDINVLDKESVEKAQKPKSN